MDRLTEKHFGGNGYYMKCSERFGCDGLCGNCDDLDALVERLAAYEDTGLTPDEVLELRKRRHGMTNTRLHRIWRSMRQRCNSPNHKDFKDYGARGISVCAEWEDFMNFYEWAMANGYSEELTLDRKDNDGSYSPENCRWATMVVQQKNKRCTRLSFNGATHTIEEWSKIIGISNSGIRYRLSKNLPIEEVLAPKVGAV